MVSEMHSVTLSRKSKMCNRKLKKKKKEQATSDVFNYAENPLSN